MNSKFKRRIQAAISFALVFSVLQALPAQAAFNAPAFPTIPVQLVSDNDYAIMLGNDSGPTSLLYKNLATWGNQLASASVIDVSPGVGDTYLYVLALGGGGDENWGGTINGQDIIYYPGAQVAVDPNDSRGQVSYWVFESDPSDPSAPPQQNYNTYYVTKFLNINSSITGLSDHQLGCAGSGCNTVADGGFTSSTLVADVQTGLTGSEWTRAYYDFYGQFQPDDGAPISDLPRPNVGMFNFCVACSAAPSNGSGKAWDFASNGAVVFRYPIASLYGNGLAPVIPNNQKVDLNWSAPSGGDLPAGYLVQYKAHTDSTWTNYEYVGSLSSTVTGLSNGINYDFRVRAADALDPTAQLGPPSNVKSATPLGQADAPLILTKVSHATSVDLTFSAPASNGGLPITNYQYSTDGGYSWLTRSPASTSTSITIGIQSDGSGTALNLNNQYSFKLRAVTAFGGGVDSEIVSTYRLTYDLNGASGTAPTTRTHFEGEAFALAAGPTRSGYLFNGWFDGSQIYSIPHNSYNYSLGAGDWGVAAQWLSLTRPIVRVGAQNNNVTPGELWSWYGSNIHTLPDVAPGWCVVDGNGHSPDWVVSSVVQDQQSTTVYTNTDFIFDGGGWGFSPDPVISFSSNRVQNINLGSNMTTASATNTGCTANKFLVTPSLPSGLSFDTSTGTISGTPLALQNTETYTITAERWVDTSTGVMNLSGTKIGYSTTTFTLSVSVPGYSTTYVSGTGGSGTVPTEGLHLQGETFTVSSGPSLSRSGFYIARWSDGTNNYLPGSTYTVGAQNITLTPAWRQNSLRGIEDNALTLAGTIVSSAVTSTTTTVSAGSNSVSIQVPSGAFTDTTTVTIYSLSNSNLAQSAISPTGDYVVNLVVAWQALNGTVPNANIPVVVTINNSSIKAGATIYQIINGTASSIGTTTQAGVAVVNLSADPVITVANPVVQAPTNNSNTPTPLVQIKKPTITSYSPKSGSDSGETIVKVEFDSLAGCSISHVSAGLLFLNTESWVLSGNSLQIRMPKYDSGEILIQISNSCSGEISQLPFTYLPEPRVEIPIKTEPEKPPTTSVENKPTSSMKLLGSTYFNLNSFALSLAAQKALKAFAARITRSSSDQVLIYGNTDSQPGLDNSILSKRRALAVAKFIRPLLTKKKISIGWFADSRPAVKGKSLAAYAKNRRVEIWLTSKN